jgi:SM-20-related protein
MVIENKILPNPYYDYPYMIIKDFLPKDIISQIQQRVYKSSESKRAEVKSVVLNSVVDSTVKESIRKTDIYDLDDDLKEIYMDSFLRHQPSIEEYFSIALTLSTDVQVLEYQKGFFYKKHSDDSNDLLDREGNLAGFMLVAPQRKITTVLFGSDYSETPKAPESFCGGELIFNYLYNQDKEVIKYEPKAGDMLVFPSNPFFSHEVKMVEEGYRLTLVQWHNGIVGGYTK